MPTQPEAKLVAKIRKYLEDEYDMLTFKYHGGVFSHVGFPDIFAMYKGHFVALEVKVPGKKPTPAQIQMLDLMASHGAATDWVTSIEEVDESMRRWFNLSS